MFACCNNIVSHYSTCALYVYILKHKRWFLCVYWVYSHPMCDTTMNAFRHSMGCLNLFLYTLDKWCVRMRMDHLEMCSSEQPIAPMKMNISLVTMRRPKYKHKGFLVKSFKFMSSLTRLRAEEKRGGICVMLKSNDARWLSWARNIHFVWWDYDYKLNMFLIFC